MSTSAENMQRASAKIEMPHTKRKSRADIKKQKQISDGSTPLLTKRKIIKTEEGLGQGSAISHLCHHNLVYNMDFFTPKVNL